MEIKIEKLPKSKIKFSLKATKEEVAHFFDMAAEKLAKEVKVSGFRPGKVPPEVAKDAMGDHAVLHEAQEIAVNDTYLQMITKENLSPVSRPENVKIVTFDEEKGIEWEGEVEIMPAVDISGWKEKIKDKSKDLKKEEVKVEDKEVDDIVSNLQKQFSDLESKEGENGSVALSEKGDWISLDMDVEEKEKYTPEQLKKFKADGFTLVIGEAHFIEGFEENLIGMKKDEEKVFDAKFPENYHEKTLAGQAVKFKVKINEIRKIVLPELDEKFFARLGFKTLEELKAAIKEDIQKRKEEEARNRYEDAVLKNLVEVFEIDCPESLVDQEKDMIMQRFVHDLEHHKGVKLIDYLGAIGKNEKELKEGFGEQALGNVKVGILLNDIRKAEKVEVADSDIEETMSMELASQTANLTGDRVQKAEEIIKERYKDEGFRHSLENSILARKTIDLIMGALTGKKD